MFDELLKTQEVHLRQLETQIDAAGGRMREPERVRQQIQDVERLATDRTQEVEQLDVPPTRAALPTGTSRAFLLAELWERRYGEVGTDHRFLSDATKAGEQRSAAQEAETGRLHADLQAARTAHHRDRALPARERRFSWWERLVRAWKQRSFHLLWEKSIWVQSPGQKHEMRMDELLRQPYPDVTVVPRHLRRVEECRRDLDQIDGQLQQQRPEPAGPEAHP